MGFGLTSGFGAGATLAFGAGAGAGAGLALGFSGTKKRVSPDSFLALNEAGTFPRFEATSFAGAGGARRMPEVPTITARVEDFMGWGV